ncbi:hypothetical protein B0J11DRAFT_83523 [Dendryphion nanum]|uniref:Uncharacterized protein n=1 Tax=Dendryphion nanum TaxID=256645 RepID=A0A9P9IH11_9PLEO|nr:hypothetical protein B0J11DRAFT_83523 [Dendryphion nanum]
MALDPNTATRREFTANLVAAPVPDNANSKYAALATPLKELLKALADHPAMAENNEQTYMTPAKWKNKIYFLWDFVGRTLAQVAAIDPQLPARQKAAWQEAMGRALNSAMLITDQRGMLDMMCPNERSEPAEFTPEIQDLAQRIMTAATG